MAEEKEVDTMTDAEFEYVLKVNANPHATKQERKRMVELLETKRLPYGYTEDPFALLADEDTDVGN